VANPEPSPSAFARVVDGVRGLIARHQFIRYLVVGGLNTALAYLIFAALLLAGLDYKWASLLQLLIGLAISFTTQGTLVFQNATRWTFAKYVIAWGFLYLFNIGLIKLLMTGASISAYLAGAIALVPVTLLSYVVLKFAVFGRARPAAPNPAG
jgi:putative flippase GtrA